MEPIGNTLVKLGDNRLADGDVIDFSSGAIVPETCRPAGENVTVGRGFDLGEPFGFEADFITETGERRHAGESRVDTGQRGGEDEDF